jgi:hypothetical protein
MDVKQGPSENTSSSTSLPTPEELGHIYTDRLSGSRSARFLLSVTLDTNTYIPKLDRVLDPGNNK